MGRPLPKDWIGKLTEAGFQLRVEGIVDSGTGLEELYIKKQKNPRKFLCADPTDTREGFIILQQETPTVEGEGRIEVSPFGASTAAADATMKVVSATIATAGTGYSPGDVLTVVGGTAGTDAQITVDTVGGSGEVTAVTVSQAGDYSALPANDVAVTGGGGSNAEFTLDWGVNAIAVTDGGEGYEDAPSVTISGGGGSGATATSSLDGDSVDSISVTAAGSGFTSVPAVTIEGSKEWVKTLNLHIVKTYEGNIYKFDFDSAADEAGEADIDVA